MGSAVAFDKGPIEVIDIEDGVVTLKMPDGSIRSTSLRSCRLSHARIGKALAEYDRALAEIAPFRREFPPTPAA